VKRRSWILGSAGVAAALAGVAWQQSRAPRAEPAPPALWQLKLARPEGGELDFATLRGQPLVLNFWATWCAPCIQEMPELDQFQRNFAGRGWRVVGLAVDSPGAVREFLKKTPVGYGVALTGFEGSQLSRELGNDKGGLPFTVVLDRSGGLVHRRLGPTSLAELSAWASDL
jgi:thiol-disulfide isomerase/thioredoxin